MRKLLIICSLTLVGVLGLSAGNLTASTVHSAAGQSSDCTTTINPGDSIQSAVNAASYGDIICIAEGTHTGGVQVNTPGVTIKGLTRRTATVINGFQINVPDVRIEALRLTTDGHFYKGPMYIWDGADNAKIYDNYFFNVDSVFSIFAPNGHAVAPSNVHVKGNDFYHVQAGIFAYGDNWLVEDNEIDTLFKYNSHDSDYARFIGSGHVFRNNYWHGALFANTGSAHVDCFQSWDENNPLVTYDTLIENNICFGFHQFMMLNSQDGRLNKMTVRNNIAVNFPEFGYLDRLQFIINQDVTDMLIEHNTFYGYIERGVLMNGWGGPNPPSGIIRNNLLYGPGPGHWTEDCNPACEVANNMIWGFTGRSGIPEDPDDILDSTEFVNPIVTNDRSAWMPLNPAACSGGVGGTYIGAVPCGDISTYPQLSGTDCTQGQICEGGSALTVITVKNIQLYNQLKGRIILQVESHGEAYYIHPQTKKMYYLGRPADAFEVMRELGLGATHEFITSHTYYPDHVLGKILLDVETNGEAYYIYPKDKKAYYLGRPADAFRVMRELGLGITNNDISQISTGEI